MQEEFDIIVIGSGLGGLECGVMLSREGMGVCIVEQAAVPGGCLQSFRRRGHSIDTGMHYVRDRRHPRGQGLRHAPGL